MLGNKFDKYLESYEPERILFEEGAEGNSFYLLKDGLVKIIKTSDDSKKDKNLIATLGPGELVGEMALVSDDSTRSASAVTQSPVTCWKFSNEQFDSLLEQSEDFRSRVLSLLSKRLADTSEQLSNLKMKNDLLYKATFVLLHVLESENLYSTSNNRTHLKTTVRTLSDHFNVQGDLAEALLSSPSNSKLESFTINQQQKLQDTAFTILKEGLDYFEIETDFDLKPSELGDDADFLDLSEAIQRAEKIFKQFEEQKRLSRETYETLRGKYNKLRDRLKEAKADPTLSEKKIKKLSAFLDEIRRHLQEINKKNLPTNE